MGWKAVKPGPHLADSPDLQAEVTYFLATEGSHSCRDSDPSHRHTGSAAVSDEDGTLHPARKG